MTPDELLTTLASHGALLASGKGPIPNLAELIAKGPIRGSWWAHPSGHEIFAALSVLGDSPDVLFFKLVGGKVTLVHRRLWAALARLAAIIGPDRLAAIHQTHTEAGHHRNVSRPFPEWVPPATAAEAAALSESEARSRLGDAFGKAVCPASFDSPGQRDKILK